MKTQRILLIIPDETEVYRHISVKAGAMHLPSLAFAVLAAIARRDGHEVDILDLTTCEDWRSAVRTRLDEFAPNHVGLTGTTSIFFHMVQIARFIKESHPDVAILAGGPHVSSTHEESLRLGCFDYIFIGEGENSFAAYLAGDDPGTIPGVALMNGQGEVHRTPEGGYLKNLDDYPFPQYDLYDLDNYPVSFIHSKQTPVGLAGDEPGLPL